MQDTQLGGFAVAKGQPVTIALNYIMKMDPRWPAATGSSSSSSSDGAAASQQPATAAAAPSEDPSSFWPERFLTPEGRAQGSQWVFGAGACSAVRLGWLRGTCVPCADCENCRGMGACSCSAHEKMPRSASCPAAIMLHGMVAACVAVAHIGRRLHLRLQASVRAWGRAWQ